MLTAAPPRMPRSDAMYSRRDAGNLGNGKERDARGRTSISRAYLRKGTRREPSCSLLRQPAGHSRACLPADGKGLTCTGSVIATKRSVAYATCEPFSILRVLLHREELCLVFRLRVSRLFSSSSPFEPLCLVRIIMLCIRVPRAQCLRPVCAIPLKRMRAPWRVGQIQTNLKTSVKFYHALCNFASVHPVSTSVPVHGTKNRYRKS